jgi:methionyl-tRNA synthetase
MEKYYQGQIPAVDIERVSFDISGEKIKQVMKQLDEAVYFPLTNNLDFSASLDKIWELVNLTNKYVEETKPWLLSKENKADQLKAFMRLLIESIMTIAEKLYPFMPETSESIKSQIGSERIEKGKPLFPRIEADKEQS